VTQEEQIRKIMLQRQLGKTVFKTLSQKKGLVDCLKVESLSSSLRQLITVDLENSNADKTTKSLSCKWYS
jgi:hypothetical protein